MLCCTRCLIEHPCAGWIWETFHAFQLFLILALFESYYVLVHSDLLISRLLLYLCSYSKVSRSARDGFEELALRCSFDNLWGLCPQFGVTIFFHNWSGLSHSTSGLYPEMKRFWNARGDAGLSSSTPELSFPAHLWLSNWPLSSGNEHHVAASADALPDALWVWAFLIDSACYYNLFC